VTETGIEKDLALGPCHQSFIIFQGETQGTDTDHDPQVLGQDPVVWLRLPLHLLVLRKGVSVRAEVDMTMKRGSDMMIIVVRWDTEPAAIVLVITPLMSRLPTPLGLVR